MRKQKAVYWALRSAETGGADWDDYGHPQYTAPVEIDCRWEEKSVEFIDPDGTQLISRAVVYVDRDMRVGEMLWLGTLIDVPTPDDPPANTGAGEIRQYEKLPTLRATQFLRTVYL